MSGTSTRTLSEGKDFITRAQAGEAREVVEETEAILRAATGDLVDGPPLIHFARAIALMRLEDEVAGIAACDLMVAAADREGLPGERSCALSLRSNLQRILVDKHVPGFDNEGVLHDLVQAENALAQPVDDPELASR